MVCRLWTQGKNSIWNYLPRQEGRRRKHSNSKMGPTKKCSEIPKLVSIYEHMETEDMIFGKRGKIKIKYYN